MFYKREENEILNGGDTVSTPSVILTAGAKDEFTYPQDGWYWFDTFDEALAYFASSSIVNTITPRQLRMQLTRIGKRVEVETKIAESTDYDLKDWYEYSTEYRRDNEILIAFANSLNITESELDYMFIEASKL